MNAVAIGRLYVHRLANARAMGVSHVIRRLRDELEIAMALCGCKTLADANSDILFNEALQQRLAASTQAAFICQGLTVSVARGRIITTTSVMMVMGIAKDIMAVL